ncbi:MAG: UDP-N-acetylmuramate--alanine ligase [Leptospiraceae bacterium]|nr:UDP-N-acetylmuramate--alanine ligase [Leptospiraceae bacterium]MCP5511325.1 UDP-N-acetylmuramate--alanine ligase [Leptospiraceae bacterium]
MNIFFIGIGGIAMGNLAYMLKKQGHNVSGSDKNLYPPMSVMLEDWGLKVFNGFDKNHLKNQDMIIVGNAISRGNPEVEEMLNQKIPYLSMAGAISKFLLQGKKVIVVAGTHGKTTTTFLVHHILKEIGLQPGLFVGGIRADNHPGFEIGNGEYFVIEGDEYDSAFFEKTSKFLNYHPHYLVLNALDFDHADIFPNIEAIKEMFRRLLKLVPSNGKIYFNEKSIHLKELCSEFKFAPIEKFGIGKKGSLLNIQKGKLYFFDSKVPVNSNLIGEHNRRNLEVALRVAKDISPEKWPAIKKSVENFPGVKRRQEILFKGTGSILMEDFAHHPVAIEETVHAVREAYPDYTILSLFEPRSATSHRNVFQKDFSKSFVGSHSVFITEVFNIKKVPISNRLNVKKLVVDTKKNSRVINSFYTKNPDDLLKKLSKFIQELTYEKIIILAMSNGAFGGIYKNIIEILEKRENQ